jgi:hypothetical protein
MAGAAADALHPDGRAAHQAGLAGPAVDLVVELEIPGVPVGVVIAGVRERRASGLDGRREDLPQGPVEPLDGLGPERRRGRLRVDARVEERLVGVDVAHTGDAGLVEEQALDPAATGPEDVPELGRSDLEGLGAEAGQLAAGALRLALETEQEAELADVAEADLVPPVLEADDQPDVLVARRPLGREQELPGHLQMENERPGALALDEEHLAPAPDAEDAAAAQGLERFPAARPEERTVQELDPGDRPAVEARLERPRDGLDLRQFGHAAILANPLRPRLICPPASTKMPLMKSKGVLAMILGWAVPGLGHAIQRKYVRAALFFVSIFAMTGLGLAMGGRVYPFQTENPLTILAFFADVGNGIFYVLARYLHWGVGSLERATFEFGTAYIAGAGLLNFLVALDAFDIGTGKKS